MTAVALRRRAIGSSASVATVVVASGFVAWLGAWQAPTGPVPQAAPWPAVLRTTEASGPLDFTMVLSSNGGSGALSTSRTVGVADFVGRDARAVTVSMSTGVPDQWVESVVVHGHAFARFGSDQAGHPRFHGPWLRSAGLSIPPLGALAGPVVQPTLPEPALPATRAQRAGLTEYVLGSIDISCDSGSGPPATRSESAEAWVDGGGRLVRFKLVTRSSSPATASVITTVVTTFGPFGASVRFGQPAPAVGPGLPPEPEPTNPLAGCLVTPA